MCVKTLFKSCRYCYFKLVWWYMMVRSSMWSLSRLFSITSWWQLLRAKCNVWSRYTSRGDICCLIVFFSVKPQNCPLYVYLAANDSRLLSSSSSSRAIMGKPRVPSLSCPCWDSESLLQNVLATETYQLHHRRGFSVVFRRHAYVRRLWTKKLWNGIGETNDG